jgi:hypothetical protein
MNLQKRRFNVIRWWNEGIEPGLALRTPRLPSCLHPHKASFVKYSRPVNDKFAGGTQEGLHGMNKLILEDAYKQFTLDQDKVLPPEDTVTRFRDTLQRMRLDILKDTVRIDNGRLGIPVYISRCGRDAAGIIGTRKQMGKGATPQQAEASAVMELAERFSFFSFSSNRPVHPRQLADVPTAPSRSRYRPLRPRRIEDLPASREF